MELAKVEWRAKGGEWKRCFSGVGFQVSELSSQERLAQRKELELLPQRPSPAERNQKMKIKFHHEGREAHEV